MQKLETEFTVTMITDGEGFESLSEYVSRKYVSKIRYETVIRYNDKISDRIENMRKFRAAPSTPENPSRKHYRVVIQNDGPISPDLVESLVVPERYYDNRQRIVSDATQRGVQLINFQEKETLSRWSETVPFELAAEGKEIFVSCSWKLAKETDLDGETFENEVLRNLNDTDKSFVPSFGQQRVCVYDVDGTRVRLSIGKGFDFGGTQEGRRPMNEYYYVEFESEITRRPSPLAAREFASVALSLIPSSIIARVAIGAKRICVDSYARIHELLTEDYARPFTYDFRQFRARAFVDGVTGRTKNVFIAPKWNGVRGIGAWEDDRIIVKTPRCLREFFLPSFCLQRLIVQVEMLTGESLVDDRVVITEIMGVSLCTREQLYGFHRKRELSDSTPGAIAGSNDVVKKRGTLSRIHPVYSMELVAKYQRRDCRHFTRYRNNVDINALADMFFSKRSAFAENPEPRTDGYLAIVVYDEGRKSLYAKLKTLHTVELIYDLRKKTLESYEGDIDFLSRKDIAIESFDPDSLYWYDTGLDSEKIVVEFNVSPKDSTTRRLGGTEDLSKLLGYVTLVYKGVRADKFVPDKNAKITNILLNILL